VLAAANAEPRGELLDGRARRDAATLRGQHARRTPCTVL
jgi:hypothetical protein